jgi:hypothetical protein
MKVLSNFWHLFTGTFQKIVRYSVHVNTAKIEKTRVLMKLGHISDVMVFLSIAFLDVPNITSNLTSTSGQVQDHQDRESDGMQELLQAAFERAASMPSVELDAHLQ